MCLPTLALPCVLLVPAAATSAAAPRVGDRFGPSGSGAPGHRFGAVGSTGCPTLPHLRLERRLNGVAVDPLTGL